MKKIIVVGNGPSLREFDLNKITFPSIGMNAAYRHWDKIGWYPDYYCCLDTRLIETHHRAIRKMLKNKKITKFLLRKHFLDYQPGLWNNPKILFLEDLMSDPAFASDKHNLITTGSGSIRFAAYLGYTQIYTIGIDCKYTEVIPEAKSVTGRVLEMKKTPKINPNYFFDDYQQAGDLYHKPREDQHLHTKTLKILKNDLKLNKPDVKIVNCNKQSTIFKYKIFPYQELKLILDS